MIVYFTVFTFALFFAWLYQRNLMRAGMKVVFALIFLFLALRYDYGNDYPGYLRNFNSLRGPDDSNFYIKGFEYGWLYLNYAFKTLFGSVGFPIMVATIALFNTSVAYRFLTRYIPQQHSVFAVALYMLETGNVLILSSAMRQSIAVSIFLLAFPYLLRRHFARYALLIGLAASFHSSAGIFVALPLLNVIDWRIRIPYVLAYAVLFLLALTRLDVLFGQIALLLIERESFYAGYASRFDATQLGFGFIFDVVVTLMIAVTVRRSDDIRLNTIAKMSLVYLTVLLLSLAVGLISRYEYYVFPAVIIGYVGMMEYFNKQPIVKLGLQSLIVAFYAVQNISFWFSDTYSAPFFEYKSLLDSPYLL